MRNGTGFGPQIHVVSLHESKIAMSIFWINAVTSLDMKDLVTRRDF